MNTKMKHAVKNVTEDEFRGLCLKWGTPDEIPIWELSEKQAAVFYGEDRFYEDAGDVEDAIELFREWQLL